MKHRLFAILSLFSLVLAAVPMAAAQDHINPLTSECWFTAQQDIPAYHDRSLTNIHPAMGTMQAGWSFQVMEVDGSVALLTIDHALGFWVATANGVFSGNCETVGGGGTQAHVLANTRLWSQPDVESGTVLADLPEGTLVTITGGSAVGHIRYGSAEVDTWYPVRYGTQAGWVWAGRLDFDNGGLPQANAVARENARLWSQPDVVSGSLLQDVAANTPLEIIGGPVSGRIRFDDPTTGVWYQVRVNGSTGWVWENRLSFTSF